MWWWWCCPLCSLSCVRAATTCLQDLLSRIFVANPAERITLAQIKQHPWFLKNLPIELAVSFT